MLGLDWTELALIAVVAVVVIGPKDLPEAVRGIARGIQKLRRMAGEFQGHVDEVVREAKLEDVRNTISEIRNFDLRSVVEKEVDSDGSLRKTFTEDPIRDAFAPGGGAAVTPPPAGTPGAVSTPPPPAEAPSFIPPGTLPPLPEPAPVPAASMPPAFVPPEPVTVPPPAAAPSVQGAPPTVASPPPDAPAPAGSPAATAAPSSAAPPAAAPATPPPPGAGSPAAPSSPNPASTTA